jgi:hypothetical protein
MLAGEGEILQAFISLVYVGGKSARNTEPPVSKIRLSSDLVELYVPARSEALRACPVASGVGLRSSRHRSPAASSDVRLCGSLETVRVAPLVSRIARGRAPIGESAIGYRRPDRPAREAENRFLL